MFEIVLYEPEIVAKCGARLHLVRPLGYTLNDRTLVRAGLDYHEHATLQVHDDWSACLAVLGHRRLYAITTRGSTRYDTVKFAEDDVLVFGPETRGLPEAVLGSFPTDRRLRLPMREHSRSLNLSNAVAIVAYEAWRQAGFRDGA